MDMKIIAELTNVAAWLEANMEEFDAFMDGKDLVDGFKAWNDGNKEHDWHLGAVAMPFLLPHMMKHMDGGDHRMFVEFWMENQHEELGKMVDAMYLGFIWFAWEFYTEAKANEN